MNIIKKITDWLLYTSIFAGACALGLSMTTEKLILGKIPNLYTPLHMLIFCSTLFVYNVHYVVKKSTAELSDRYAWSQKNKPVHYALILVGVLGCLYAVLYLPTNVIVACCVLGLLSFSYSLPLLPFLNKKRLKDFGWIKIFVLTSVWTIVTSVLPILYWSAKLSAYPLEILISITDFPYEILMRFVFMFTLCVAFDIRDMQTDMDAGIATLPNLIGIKGCYRVMSISMILFIIMCIVQYIRYPSLGRVLAELSVAFTVRLAIDYSRTHPSDRTYLGLVDGMMMMYALLILTV